VAQHCREILPLTIRKTMRKSQFKTLYGSWRFVIESLTRPIAGDRESRVPPKVKANHVYEVRPRKDKRGVDLISDALPFGRVW
jgi:hypothetical protein